MPRRPRVAPGGWIYHVLNRSAGRIKLFRRDKDFEAFDRLLLEAYERLPLCIYSYCVMNNHWHFLVRPQRDGELTEFFRWLTHTHAMRWRVSHRSVGYGHLYGGRFKAFPVQGGESFLKICRYVERNSVTAGAVTSADEYPWGSLWVRAHGTAEQKAMLSPWPVARPRNWLAQVNEAITAKEQAAWQASLERSRPFGDDGWMSRTVLRLGLEHTIRREGRPVQAKGSENGTSHIIAR